jgi:two-component system phosphate regulon sensor histidine kinase PhoR
VSFAGRLVLGTFSVVVLALLVFVWGSERTLRTSLEADLLASLQREARLVASMLPRDSTRWQGVVDRVADEEGHRIVVANSTGRVLVASDTLVGARVMHAEVTYGAHRITTAARLDAVDAAVASARKSMLLAASSALLVALALAFLAGRSIARPLVELSNAAHAIAQGAQPRFPRSNIPEVEALAQALRQMHRDLADRFTELQQERASTTAIVDAMSDGMVAANARGRVVLVNAAARRMLGYDDDETFPDLQTLFRKKLAREAVAEALKGQSVQDREVEMDGRILALNARPAGDAGTVLILRDLTERRRLESVRRDFVANVSHELKTPLTSISGYAETLVGGDVDPATAERFLRTILGNAQRMQFLVDDLLDLSRVESGRWSPKVAAVDVEPAVTEAWTQFADRAHAKQVELRRHLANDATPLQADPEAIRHILGNLFDNALRYVDHNGSIVVSTRRLDDGIELSVTDDGSGIPAEHLPRIFERFYRVDPSRSREEGGTGLGLSIVKHMIEAHGGRVSAESELRRGTTVRCWFPGGG